MKNKTVWVMKTTCKHCNKVHQVKGLRRNLIELLDEEIAKCGAGENIPVIDIKL